MMFATFNSNHCSTVINCNSPTTASDKTDINIYNKQSLLVQHIPNHNVLIIDVSMNVQIMKNGNNRFWLHKSPNRNDRLSMLDTAGEV